MRAPPVLLLQLGEAPDAVRARHGGYHGWYERAWDGPLQVRDGRAGGRHPDPRDFAGIVLTGSRSSLVTPEPWMDDAADLVRCAHQAGTPVLGVCFGHQLVAHAFGARVVRNPRGWEVGSWPVALTDDGRGDPLFAGVSDPFTVNLTHEDVVDPAALPPGVRVLARNDNTDVQALAVDEHVRGVQFHPELSGEVTRGYVEARRVLLAAYDPDALIARTRDCPDGVAVLRNFRRGFVERA